MKSRKDTSPLEKVLPNFVGGRVSEMATYSDLFENMPDPIFLLDPETLHVVDHNPAARRAFGTAPGEINGGNFLDWADPAVRASIEANLQSLRAERKVAAPFDCPVVLPGRELLLLELSACRLNLADYCQVLQVIAKDVTAARANALALVRANAELDQLSRTDAMTGLHNFRSLKARLADEHERCRRYGKPYSVILCDVDHFKKYNDQNGHPEGDKALRQTAGVLQNRARLTDFVARYGGEEFVVLCPEVNAEQAKVLAESLRASVEREEFPHGARQPLGRVTISLGVAEFPRDGQSADEILAAADKALYASKEAGRNRVTLSRAAGAVVKKKSA